MANYAQLVAPVEQKVATFKHYRVSKYIHYRLIKNRWNEGKVRVCSTVRVQPKQKTALNTKLTINFRLTLT
jgi:hypothetical protein